LGFYVLRMLVGGRSEVDPAGIVVTFTGKERTPLRPALACYVSLPALPNGAARWGRMTGGFSTV
jgi:hypothetical protein